MFTRFATAVVVATSIIAFGAVPAQALTIDDPNLFGPGEGWDEPVTIEPGDAGPWVEQLQIRLAEAGFRPGTPDGRYGRATLGAVYAFQKVHDLPRDGLFVSEYWDLLDVAVSLPESRAEPNRVEVDLEAQVLYLIENNEVDVIVPISSGNGETYRGRSGTWARARTPEGTFSFQRHISGWRISYLGGLYNPYYFYGGYAIHGSSSVPPYPASHGCVRVEMHDMNYLRTRLSLGMSVHVYGNGVQRSELLPPPPVKPSDYLPTVSTTLSSPAPSSPLIA